jgi:hypothetical protein
VHAAQNCCVCKNNAARSSSERGRASSACLPLNRFSAEVYYDRAPNVGPVCTRAKFETTLGLTEDAARISSDVILFENVGLRYAS